MTVPETSEPEFSCFGSNIDHVTTMISMKRDEIIIYPDKLHIRNKDKMVLIK